MGRQIVILRDLAAAEAALVKYIPAVMANTGSDLTLERISVLLRAVGNPQDQLRVIHIAGTSGKTSTAYYLASLLRASGQTVGLTVSPHIDSITERLQVNSRSVSEAEFCGALGEFLDLIADVDPEPSYFELLIAFAYWYFAKIGVGYAVIETGMGGLYDSTNIANRADKVCVITDIGLDHTKFLGDTVEAIAAQKAGIIYPGNHVFMYRQTPSVTKVFTDYIAQQNAELHLLEESTLGRVNGLDDLPLYQQRNWLLAREAVTFIAGRDNWVLSAEVINSSLKLQVPGRMDLQIIQGKTLVMDGAHNEQKIAAFVKSFQEQYREQQVPILLAMKEGKEYETVLPLLQPICSQLILTTFDVLQDLPSRSIDPALLATAATQLGYPEPWIIQDAHQAFAALLEAADPVGVVTGSFYLLSVIRDARLQKQR